MARDPNLERAFPTLCGSRYDVTSPPDKRYNCIAWAAGDSQRWWWPQGGYWPPGAARALTVDGFVEAFKTLGFVETDCFDVEAGVEKVAIYALGGVPTHAARQQPDGMWASKLGVSHDIVHEETGVSSGPYGSIVALLRRP